MSQGTPVNELTVRTGKIVDPNMVFLLLEDPVLAEENVPHTNIAIWQRGKDFHRTRLDYNGVSAALIPGKPGVNRQIVVIGNDGKFTEFSGGRATEGIVENDLASVACIHGSAIAVGVRGRIACMVHQGFWETLTNEKITTNIECVCEYHAGRFLVCGWKGLIALYNNDNEMSQFDSGTDAILTSITCDEEGKIFACGLKGTIVYGQSGSLRPLMLEGVIVDLWSIAKFRGDIYVSSTTGLYKLINNEALELVKFDGEVAPTSFGHIDTYEDSFMLSVGQKDVVLFDGKGWTRIF